MNYLKMSDHLRYYFDMYYRPHHNGQDKFQLVYVLHHSPLFELIVLMENEKHAVGLAINCIRTYHVFFLFIVKKRGGTRSTRGLFESTLSEIILKIKVKIKLLKLFSYIYNRY